MRLFLAPLLLLAACSRGAPDDLLLLSGQVLEPQAGAVSLERRLSLACFHDQPSGMGMDPFELLERRQPADEGHYAFELYRAQAHPSTGQPACFRLRSEAHPRSELRTQFYDADVRLPALGSWGPAPSWLDGAWRAPPPPELPEGNVFTYHAQEWALETLRGPAWRVFGADPFVPTPELFEDFGPAQLDQVARAWVLTFDQSLGLLFATYSEAALTLRTPAVAVSVEVPASLPVSRGGECWLDGVRWEACPWADGQLEWSGPPEGRGPLVQQLELRWAVPSEVRTLVVRGLELAGMRLRVELAEGEGPWVEVAAVEAPVLADDEWGPRSLATPGLWEQLSFSPTRADRVRLTSEAGGILGLRELSFFD